MKIAIQESVGFSDHWINYCIQKKIEYKIVNVYTSDVINQISDCDALMWHIHHTKYQDALFAKQLMYSLQIAGKRVFPDFNTSWHFDDKVGQKYLLEAIGAPLVPSYAFYSKSDAIKWAENTTYPKVFKLRGGAGSSNVHLAKTKQEALSFIKASFNRGISQNNSYSDFKERLRKYRSGKSSFLDVVKGLIRFVYPPEYARMHHKEKGYVYFQDFIPNNSFDVRVIVVDDKAFAIKRMTRKNDFRASGSGEIIYRKSEIDESCVQTAFEVNDKLKSQCVAYDFVFDKDKNPLIVEIGFGFVPKGYFDCEGFWDKNMIWYEGKFDPYGWMVENLITS